MLAFRGAARCCSPRYCDRIVLACRAIRSPRDDLGFGNVVVMVPFWRTPEDIWARQGTKCSLCRASPGRRGRYLQRVMR